MAFFKEFKEFAVKGNVVDMGVGIVIGAAFTSVVNSLVQDIFNPLLSLMTANAQVGGWFWVIRPGAHGGPYRTLAEASRDHAVTLNVGSFINAIVSFLIVAFVLFFLVRTINSLKRPADAQSIPEDNRECPHCFSTINVKASRCAFCTSEITPLDPPATRSISSPARQ